MKKKRIRFTTDRKTIQSSQDARASTPVRNIYVTPLFNWTLKNILQTYKYLKIVIVITTDSSERTINYSKKKKVVATYKVCTRPQSVGSTEISQVDNISRKVSDEVSSKVLFMTTK